MKGFLAYLLFRFLPVPRYRFWLSQRGADYALFYRKCKALALQWVKEQHMALDDDYRRQNLEAIRTASIISINRRHHGELPNHTPKN